MLFTREQINEMVLALYPEAKNDPHWQSLIKHRAFAHLKRKGIKITVAEHGYYRVEV